MYRFLQTCSFTLSAIGLFSLVLSHLVSPLLAGGTFLVLLLSTYRHRWGINLSRKRYLFLLPIPVAILLADRFVSPALPWLMHITIFLLALKYWSPVFERDILQIYTISFIHIVSSAAVAQDVSFGLLLLVYVFAAVWGFIAFNCARDVRQAAGERDVAIDRSDILRRTPFRPLSHLPFVTVAGLSMALLLGLTGSFFVIIPRAGVPAVLGGTVTDLRAGFSDSVELGSIGRIKMDDEVVLRVAFPDGTGALAMANQLYWRATTLDRFDGREWSRTLLVDRRDIRRTRSTGDRFQSGLVRPGETLVRQQILLNPIGTQYLFGLPEMMEVKMDSGRVRQAIYSPADGSWRLDYRPAERLLYEVHSAPEYLGGRQAVSRLGRERMGNDFYRAYIQLPDSIRGDLSAVAWDWTGTARTAQARADAIQEHLRTGFTYSLEMGSGGKPVSVVEFLTKTKRGHCEYYASSMALLLRVLGVPTRVVTGFLAGEWNPNGNYFIVRQRDAHSWVEAYIPSEGWVTYDPTPPGTGSPLIRPGAMAAAQHLLDSVQLRWSRYVLSFQLQDQLGILHRIRSTAARTSRVVGRPWREITKPERRPYGIAGLEFVVMAIIFGTIGVIAYRSLKGRSIARPEWRRRWRRLRLSRKQVGLARDYLDLIRYCEKRSHPKDEGETYLEFTRDLEEESERFAGLSEATELYYRQRFALHRNGKADRERIRKISRKIRRRTRGGGG